MPASSTREQPTVLLAGYQQDLRNILMLSLVWLGLCALLHPVGDFPINDDWIYARSVAAILDNGQFQLIDWSQATALPQAYLASAFCRIFGFSFTALRISTLIFGLTGAIATYAWLREVSCEPLYSLVGAMSVAVNPLYFYLANTFMTDVPFYSFAVLSMVLITRGFHREDPKNLICGILVAYLAVLTRQLGIVILIGFAIAYLWSKPIAVRTFLVCCAPLAIGLLLHFGLHHFLVLHGRKPDVTTAALFGNVMNKTAWELARNIIVVVVYSGLFALPASIIQSAEQWGRKGTIFYSRRFWLGVGVEAVFLLLVVSIFGWMPIGGNILKYFGFGPLALRDTGILFINSPPISIGVRICWSVITAMAVAGTLYLFLCGWKLLAGAERRDESGELKKVEAGAVFITTTYLCFCLMITIITMNFFDRYILFCVPFALIIACRTLPGPISADRRLIAPCFSAALLMLSATYTIVGMRDYFAWNTSRWQALSDLTVGRGIPASSIDGGYEFNGWNLYHPGFRPRAGKSWWWVEDDQYVLASGPIDGYREIASYPFERSLLRTSDRVLVLRKIKQ